MYATLSRLEPRKGQEQAVLDHLFRWEQEYLPGVRGYVDGYVFEPAMQPGATPESILVILVFASQAASISERNTPEQNRWDRDLRKLLAHAPECSEGEITQLRGEPHGL